MGSKIRVALTAGSALALGYFLLYSDFVVDLVWMLAAYFSHRLYIRRFYVAFALTEWAISWALLWWIMWRVSGIIQKYWPTLKRKYVD